MPPAKTNIEGVKRDEPFGPGYVMTEEEQFRRDRAEVAHRFLRDHPGEADPYEMLYAVVWPTEEMLEAQKSGGPG